MTRSGRLAVRPTQLVYLGTAVIALVAAIVVARPFYGRPAETTTQSALCAGYAQFKSALPQSGPAEQFGLRRLATRLEQLAGQYPRIEQQDSLPAVDAAAQIHKVLSLPYATARDLWVAARPVAAECGDDPRTGSPSTYAIIGRDRLS